MKRRKVLKTAGALAGAAALAACGGGEGGEGGGAVSEIGAYTIPGNLLPSNGQYQVEVVFGLPLKVNVTLSDGVGVRTMLASKPETGGWSHRVGFAKLRVTNEATRDRTYLRLRVTEFFKNASGVETSVTYNAGAAQQTTSSNVQYKADNPGPVQYEWRFYTSDPARQTGQKKLFCCVRFYKLPVAEHWTFPSGTYLTVVPNNAPIDNLNGQGHLNLRSQHLPTSLSHPSHESMARKNGTVKHNDTVIIPDRQQPAGYHMLVPTLYHASPELRPMLERHLHRHVANLAEKQRAVQGVDGMEDTDHHHLVSNEILRLVGGETLVENMRSYRQKVFDQLESVFGSVGTGIAGFIDDQLKNVLTSDMERDSTRALNEAIAAVRPPGTDNDAFAFTFTDTVSVQTAASIAVKDWPFPPISPGGGVRVSFPLRVVSAGFADRLEGPSVTANSEYKINNAQNILKFQIVPIIKLSTDVIGASVDIEVTINFSVLNRTHVMIEAVTFDAVMDWDLRNLVGRLCKTALVKLAQAASLPLQAYFTYSGNYDYAATQLRASADVAASRMETLAALSSEEGGLPRAVEDVVDPVLTNLVSKVQDFNFNVFELSPLRFKWAHADLGKVAQSSATKRWVRGSSGYCPAVKNIFGFGGRLSNAKPVDPCDLSLGAYLRIVNTMDISLVTGSEDFLETAGLVFP